MNSMICQNCSVSHGPDDMFCENCGYDFITGSLPVDGEMAASPPPVAPSVLDEGEESGSAGAASGEATGDAESAGAAAGGAEAAAAGVAGVAGSPEAESPAGDVPRVTLTISVDKEFFDQVVNDGEIDFPDPVPADQELVLAGAELHIGRTSDSRAIHPDIDVADLTGDQAVSSRHAVLRVANDGTYTIVDVGSTNGTFLDEVDSDAVDHGIPIAVKPGMPIYVGAWTRLTIAE